MFCFAVSPELRCGKRLGSKSVRSMSITEYGSPVSAKERTALAEEKLGGSDDPTLDITVHAAAASPDCRQCT
jgi:hypothetical protein